MPAYELGKKEEEMMEPKRIEDKSEKLYNFDFEKFDKMMDDAIEILYPEEVDSSLLHTILPAAKLISPQCSHFQLA